MNEECEKLTVYSKDVQYPLSDYDTGSATRTRTTSVHMHLFTWNVRSTHCLQNTVILDFAAWSISIHHYHHSVKGFGTEEFYRIFTEAVPLIFLKPPFKHTVVTPSPRDHNAGLWADN